MSNKKPKQKNKPKPDDRVPKTLPAEKSLLLDSIKGREFFIAFMLITIVAFFVFKDFLLFNKVMLYKDIGSDTLNGLFPIMKHTADYIHTSGIPSWSFNHGMGQNIFPFFVRGPVDILLYLLDKDHTAYGIGYIEFFKVIAGGMIFFLYLRTLNMSGYVCIVGALLFSFSGFMILGGTWFLFSSDAVSMALLLLAFEKLFKNNSWHLFPVSVAVIGISMPFNLYLFGIFLALYAALRFLEEKDKFQWKEFLKLFGTMALLGLFGLLISSVFLFENILQLLESPRGSGVDSHANALLSAPLFATGAFLHNVTAIMRLFSSDLLGTGVNFKGWNNYLEAPIFYSGLLSLVLFPQVFPSLSKRKKIVYGVFFLIWILPVVFPYLRYSFWLFTGDYYRGFSFFVSLTFIFLTAKALNAIDRSFKINLPVLITTFLVLFGVLSYPYFENVHPDPIDRKVMSFVKIIMVLYAVLVYGLSQKKIKQYAQVLLLLTLCIELGYLSSLTVNRRSIVTAKEMMQKVGYNDYTVDAIDFLKKRDQGFYRVDKNYHSTPAMHASLNDGMVQDYFGTSAYNSFNQLHFVLFLQAMDIAHKGVEEESRWANGLRGKPALECIGSVKYLLNRKDDNPPTEMQFDSIAEFGDVSVYQNKFFLPLGFTYDNFFTRSEFDRLPTVQKQFSLLKTFFVDDNEKEFYSALRKFELKDTIPMSAYTWDVYRSNIEELKKDTMKITSWGQTFFNGNIHLPKKKLLFLSIPYDKGWKASVNGHSQELKIVNAGMTGIILNEGDNAIELKYTPRLFTTGLLVSAVSLLLYMFLLGKRKKKAQEKN